MGEGGVKFGAVGDHGTSFGPFQLHVGGALPRGKGAAWANSPAGIDYAVRQMAQYVGSKTGAAGVSAAVRGFERPADPNAEIARDMAYGNLGAVGRGVPAGGVPGAARQPMGMTGSSAQGGDFRNAFAQYLLQSSANTARGGMPDFSGLLQLAQMKQQQGPPQLGVQLDHNDPISPNAAPVVNLAKKYLGTKYVWGGANPKTGFDCSGFVQWVYGRKGVSLGRTTYQQYKEGTPIKQSQLQAGDVVFFEPGAQGPNHEGMYIGHGQFIQSPHTGDVVKISKLADYQNTYVGARRVA
jgi:cell wall-associated NlpC family hydrolase